MNPTLLATILIALAAGGPPSGPLPAPASAPTSGGKGKVFLTQDEALKLAFPKCEIERKTRFLSEEERKQASKLAGKGVDVESRVVYVYEARRDGKLVGTAYFDAHVVRSLREVVMFVVGPERTIQRFELLSFAEPLDYVPRTKWYAQFVGKKLDSKLSLKGDIKGVTGATLTATATTKAARRTLALHEVLFPAKKRG